ncbi:hypothetical protein EDB84DRAFT_1199237 [Lactarius hengduanensis]|nr:hypothetical protein EDB84DRAFT_1199237 [Lactarius hengduanensis]
MPASTSSTVTLLVTAFGFGDGVCVVSACRRWFSKWMKSATCFPWEKRSYHAKRQLCVRYKVAKLPASITQLSVDQNAPEGRRRHPRR